MSIRNIDDQKNELLEKIEISDTISKFMDKCNKNFSSIVKWGGGPDGKQGEKGDIGIPTKPKVPIHVWVKGKEYIEEKNFTLTVSESEDLTNIKYQEGHLIMLENGHVYILEVDNTSFKLNPKFIIALQTYDPSSVIDGKTAYIHIAYANSPDGSKDFITDQKLRTNNKNNIDEEVTENYSSNSSYSNTNINTNSYTSNKLYIGIYSDNNEESKEFKELYTWIRLRNIEYNVNLSDPIIAIPVGDDNCCINTTNYSTSIYIYDNISDISGNNNVSISLPENEKHFTTIKENDINKIVFNPIVNGKVFEFKSNEHYKLPITISYGINQDINDDFKEDIFTTIINWTLIPIKNTDAKIFVSKNVINTSISNKHVFKVGYHLTSFNGYKKFIDDNNSKINNREYKIILTNNIENLNSYNVVNDWKNASYTFVENEDCYVILIDPKNSKDPKDWEIIDYTTITTVFSATHLELTKEHIVLPYNIDGTKIHPDYNTSLYPIQSQLLLYVGDVLIENNITYTFTKPIYSTDENGDIIKFDDTIDITVSPDGYFNIPPEIIEGDTEIKCVAIHNGKKFQKTLFIELKETPYKLEFNKNILSRDSKNQLKDDILIVYVKYYMDGEWIIPQNQDDIKLCIKAIWRNDRTETLEYDYDNNYHYINIDKNNFKNDDSIENIKINCYKNEKENNILISETIYIINDSKINDLETKDQDGLIVSKISPEELNSDEIDYANTYTQIDKNGIFIKSKNETNNTITTFCVKNGEILMQVGNYGIKITSTGIKQTTDGNTWLNK